MATPLSSAGVKDSSDPWLVKQALGLDPNSSADSELWREFNQITKDWFDHHSGIAGSAKWGDVRAHERRDITHALMRECEAKGVFVDRDLEFLARWRAIQLFKNARKEKPGGTMMMVGGREGREAGEGDVGGEVATAAAAVAVAAAAAAAASAVRRPYDPVRGC